MAYLDKERAESERRHQEHLARHSEWEKTLGKYGQS